MENSLEYSKSINRLIGPFHSYVRITNNWEAFQTNRVLTCSAARESEKFRENEAQHQMNSSSELVKKPMEIKQNVCGASNTSETYPATAPG